MAIGEHGREEFEVLCALFAPYVSHAEVGMYGRQPASHLCRRRVVRREKYGKDSFYYKREVNELDKLAECRGRYQ